MRIETRAFGPLQANAYLVWDDPERAVLVDPGDEPERVLHWVRDCGVALEAVLLTHAHFDHVGAVRAVVEAYDLPVRLHPAARPVYERAASAAMRWGLFLDPPPTEPLVDLAEGSLDLGPGFRVWHLPGHCPGHVAFYQPEAEAVFSGDLLFAGGVGRWDLPGADLDDLRRSIRRLFKLPEATRVHPGHGPATTLAAERRGNPFVQDWLD
ncbi:MBL fold metallo-hydrolase [Deinococcota bacterium DY0809b]